MYFRLNFTLLSFSIVGLGSFHFSACTGGETHLVELYQPTDPSIAMEKIDMTVVEQVDSQLDDDSDMNPNLEDQEIENLECGIEAPSIVQAFSSGPLRILSANCATVGCHNESSFTRFKLSFNINDESVEFTEEQVQEGLSVIEPLIIEGEGAMSLLAQRMIDPHSDLNFTSEDAEYQDIVSWIDQITPCP